MNLGGSKYRRQGLRSQNCGTTNQPLTNHIYVFFSESEFSIAVCSSVQNTLQNEKEEGNQRLLVNETISTELCSPGKR